MPETTLQHLVEILKKYPEGKAELYRVEMDLCEAGIVGLGVEPIDIIFAAAQRGLCEFDPKNQVVVLKSP